MREPRSPQVNLSYIYPEGGTNPNAPSRSRQLVRSALLGLAISAVVAVLVGLLSPSSTFKAATKGSGTSKATTTRAVGPAPAPVTTTPMKDPTYPYRPLQTQAPTPAGLPGGLIQDKAPADGDSGEGDGYGETTTDDVDDDYGDDYEADLWGGLGSQLNGSTNAAYNSLVLNGWQAMGGSASRLCYATNGRELRQMASGTDCTVIILTRPRAKPYTLAKTVTVNGYKIIVGNPIDLPIVDGYVHHLDRCFEVMPNAVLDLRFIDVIRAYGTKYGPDSNAKLIAGACVMIHPFGTLFATGTIFQIENQDLDQFLYDAEVAINGLRYRVLGGFILQLGGIVHLNGCYLITVRPFGMPYLNNIVLGRDVAVFAGALTMMGCFNVNAQACSVTGAVGTAIAVLGGVVTWVGGSAISVMGMQAQYGAGVMVFVGGGVFVTAGLSYVTVAGVLHRAGFSQFAVASGVTIHIGFHQGRVWGTACIQNFGHTLAGGVGIFHMIGGALASTVHQWFFSGVGGTAAQAQGDLFLVGVAQCRAVVSHFQIGHGFVWSNGGGSTTIVASPYAVVQLVRAQIGMGTEAYQGAGIFVNVAGMRAQAQLVNFFAGLGSTYYLGAGGMLLVGSYTDYQRLIDITNTPNSYTVGTVGITKKQAKKPFWITNGQATPLRRQAFVEATQDESTTAPTTEPEDAATLTLEPTAATASTTEMVTEAPPTPTAAPTDAATVTSATVTVEETAAPTADLETQAPIATAEEASEQPGSDSPPPTAASSSTATSVVVEPATGTTLSPTVLSTTITTTAPTAAATLPPTLAPTLAPTAITTTTTSPTEAAIVPPTLAPTAAPLTTTADGSVEEPLPGPVGLGGIPEGYAANQRPNWGGKNIIFIADDTTRGRYPARTQGAESDLSHPPTVSQLPSKQSARVMQGFPTFDGVKALIDGLWKGRDTVEAPKPKFSFTNTDRAHCIVANMHPGPSMDYLPEGASDHCQAIDVHVPPTTDGSGVFLSSAAATISAVQAAASPAVPIDNIMPMALLRATKRMKGDGSVPLPDTGIVSVDLTFFCTHKDRLGDSLSLNRGCVDGQFLKPIITKFMNLSEVAYTVADESQMPASFAKILETHAKFDYEASMMPDYRESSTLCQGYTRFKVHSVTHHGSTMKLLQQRWETVAKDPSKLFTRINTAVQAAYPDSPTILCDMAVSKKLDMTYPSMERATPFRPSNSRAIGPSVSIGDGVSPTAATELNLNQTVQVYIYNFPDKHDIAIELRHSTDANGLVIINIDGFADRGYSTVDWTIDRDVISTHFNQTMESMAQDRFYLYAFDRDLPALKAFSQTFRIHAEQP